MEGVELFCRVAVPKEDRENCGDPLSSVHIAERSPRYTPQKRLQQGDCEPFVESIHTRVAGGEPYTSEGDLQAVRRVGPSA